MALKQLKTFDMSSPTRAAACVRRFELNVLDFANETERGKANRLHSVIAQPGEIYSAAPGEFVLAGNGATVILPEPSPSFDGLEVAVSAYAGGTVSVQCNSGKPIVRGSASVTYSSVEHTRFLCSGAGWY